MTSIAIIGAGISGLTLGYQLQKNGVSATVFEGGSRVGGALQTIARDGCLMEAGPDSLLLAKPAAIDLARELGLELIEAQKVGPPGVVHHGTIAPLPDGFRLLAPTKLLPFARTPLLTFQGKLRAGMEWAVPAARHQEDESLAAFVTRRFGREVLDTLAQPLIGGIYAADPERLSVLATLPMFRQLENSAGSVTAGLLAQLKKAPGAASAAHFVTPRQGMGSLVQALAERLPDLRRQSPVSRLTPTAKGWEVEVHGESSLFSQVVFACGAPQQARLSSFDPQLSELLGRIGATSTVTVHLLFDEVQFRHELQGSGFVVPHTEGCALTACTYSHRKYEGRAPRGKALLRCHLGNAMRQDLVRLADQELVELVLRELRPLVGLRGEPQTCLVTRHWEVLPQYDVGHLQLVQSIENRAAEHPGLFLAGNAFRGVGIADCVALAQKLAQSERLSSYPNRAAV